MANQINDVARQTHSTSTRQRRKLKHFPAIRRQFKIKIAPDWHYACDGQTMVFPCRINPNACRNKGLEPTPECPCSCHSTIQDFDIITTPQLIVLAGELVRLTTGFNNPWNVPPITSCVNISL